MAVEDGMPAPDEAARVEQADHGRERSAPVPAPAPAGETARPAPSASGRGHARSDVLEWLTLRRTVRDARALASRTDAVTQALHHRAQLAWELAERVREPVDPLRSGSGAPHAVDLYRQSTYWSLRALHPRGPRPPSAAELWSAAQPLAQWAVPEPGAREALRALFTSLTFVEIGELGEADQQRLARDARALAHAALEALEEPQRAVGRLLFRRTLRLVLIIAAVAFVIGGALWLAEWSARRPDLAAGRPWRASSTWAVCEPAIRRCGALRTDIFFHTKEDPSPWVEIDLGGRKRFSAVTIANRTDDAPDRAIPLVIEISDDAKTWRGVARRKESFRTWTAEFKPQTARYVRARVDRRSYLHLEKVMVHP